LRIIDVNLNRLDESLKLVEDIIRFDITDHVLLSQIRIIRRAFLDLKRKLPLKDVILARQSRKDPGRKTGFDIKGIRDSNAVILSNITRAKEAARTLEETCKTFDNESSRLMKEIRFNIYDLEKDIITRITKKFDPSLHVIIDEHYLQSCDVVEVTKTLTANGATMIQLRVTTLTDRAFSKYAHKIRKAIGEKNVKFIVNNRADIAIACNAHGIHLGQNDMPVSTARRIMGDAAIIGASARSIKEALKAERDGADYLGVGAIYPTKTKPDAGKCTIRTLRSICRSVKIPVIGIGGVNDRNYKSILRAGAAGIAVASFVFGGNVKNRLRSLTRK
jgi:thiamine-phosphate pyrophosphorylase